MTRKDVRKALLERSEINEYRTLGVTYCGGFTAQKDKDVCLLALDKVVGGRIETMVGAVITDGISKASQDLIAQLADERCVVDYTARLTEASQVITGTTCEELTAQWVSYQESLNPPE